MFTLDRASLWKRISAWLLDFILRLILAAGVAFVFGWLVKYDSYLERYEEKFNQYQAEYDTDFSYTEEEYNALDPEEKAKYEAAYIAFSDDEEVIYNWNMMINLALIMVSLGVLVAIMVTDFVVPLIIKNGQTIGKLCFNICLVRSDCVKVNNLMLFTRALLGKYAIESVVPLYVAILLLFNNGGIIWVAIVGILFIAQTILLFATRDHTVIHDLLAGTVVVDKSSQMIYQSTEELVKAKEEQALEEGKAYKY